MSHAEFIDWMAFASIEPLPSQRADLHTAMLMFLTAQTNKKKGGAKLKLDAFIPDFWQDKRDPRRLAAKFRMLTSHLDEPSDPSVPAIGAGIEGNNENGERRRG